MECRIKKDRWIGILLTAAYFLLIFMVFPITYAINDDVGMRSIASGALSGTPDAHLIFVKYALGAVLRSLYSVFQCVDWYGLLWIACIMCSALLVLYRLYEMSGRQKEKIWIPLLIFLGGFALVCLDRLVNFQFTVTAGITGGAAIFFYATMDEKAPRAKKLAESAVVLLMFWISYCIRTKVCDMAIPFAGLVFLTKKQSRKEKAVLLLTAVLGIVCITKIETAAYAGEEWKTYFSYNSARAKVLDYYGIPSYAENREFYDSLEMNEEDVVNLERYNFYLVDGLVDGKMRAIAEYGKEKWQTENPQTVKIKRGIKKAIGGFLNPNTLLLNLAAKAVLLYNLFYEIRRRKWTALVSASLLGGEGMIWLYLGYQGRLPARVGAALLFIALLTSLGILFQEHAERSAENRAEKPGRLKIGLLALLLAAAGIRGGVLLEEQQQRWKNNAGREELNRYLEGNSENVYFSSAILFSGDGRNFRLKNDCSLSNFHMMGGWSAFSPSLNEGLAQQGIQNVDTALVENDNVYLLLRSPSSRINAHYESRYGKLVWEKVGSAPYGDLEIPIYDISPEKENKE